MCALAACAAVLWWGGAIGAANKDILLDPGWTPWLLPLFKVTAQAAAAVTVGCLLAPLFFVPDDMSQVPHDMSRVPHDGPRVATDARPWLRTASWSATVWAAATAMVVLLTSADLIGLPVSRVNVRGALDVAASTESGQGLLLVLVLTVTLAYRCRSIDSVGDMAIALLLAVVAVLPPAFNGHAAASTNHQLAISLMLLHVVGAVLWTGGLVALLLARRRAARAVARYSRLAVWTFVVVGVSGLVSAVLRLASPADLASAYGAVLGLKLAALAVLGGFGWWHRRTTIPALLGGNGRAFTRFAWTEVLVMAATLGLAGGLARTPPPSGYGIAELVDLPLRRALEWVPDPVFLTLAIAAIGCYLAGARRLGEPWPIARTASWIGGWLAVVAATTPELTNPVIWSYNAAVNAQHVALAIVAPALLVAANPVTLAHRTVRPATEAGMRGPLEWLATVRDSRTAKWVARPPAAFALYAAALLGAYASASANLVLYTHAGHLATSAAILAASCVATSVLARATAAPPLVSLRGRGTS